MPTLLQKHRCKRKPTWITVNWDESTSIDTKLNYITRSQRPWLPPYRTSHPKHQPIIRTYSNNVFSRIENTSTILNTSSTHPQHMSKSPDASLSLSLYHRPLHVHRCISRCICLFVCLRLSALMLIPGLCMTFAAVQDSDVVLELTVLPVEVKQKHTKT